MKESSLVKISEINYYAGRECDSYGHPAKWASIHIEVFWDVKYQKYIIKEESYLGTGSCSNKYESDRVFNLADGVNKALHQAREHADYYRQAYKD